MEPRNYNLNELQSGQRYTFILINPRENRNDVFEGRVRSVSHLLPTLKTVFLEDVRINGIRSAPIEIDTAYIVSITGLGAKIISIEGHKDFVPEINKFLGTVPPIGGRKTIIRKGKKRYKKKV